MQGKCTVIYVMSDVRSGSTLLENILSKSSETVSIGELALLKNHLLRTGPGARWNWNCSCGKPPAQCPFWSKILEDLPIPETQFSTAVQWNYRSKRMVAGSFLSVLIKNKLEELNEAPANRNTIATNFTLYRKIFAVTGKRFIVDASKDPVQAYLTYLNKPDDMNVKIINLKRDLRAIAASKSKWSVANCKKQKSLSHWLANSLFYKKICIVVSQLVNAGDVVSLSYEDLAARPQEQLDAIAEVCGLKRYAAPAYMVVENEHSIAGTPQRFAKRPIAYDASWQAAYKEKPLLSFFGKVMNRI